MVTRYIFKDDGPVAIKNAAKADSQKIGEALAKLTEEANGRLTPQAVVEAARSPRSPMHKVFEWDDSKAAHAYRIEQARDLIRVVRVIEDNGPPERAYLSIGDKGGVSYRASEEVKNSRDLQLAVLRQAERDLEAWERRYISITDICGMVSVAREKLTQRRNEMESRG